MECPRCGMILDDSETSCKNCGEKIKANTLNSISKGGGKTQTPTEEEKKAVVEEKMRQAQVQAQAQMQVQPVQQNYMPENSIDPQQYMAMQQALNSKKYNTLLAIVGLLIVVALAFGGFLLYKKNNSSNLRAAQTNPPTETQKDINDSSEAKEEPQQKVIETTDVQIGDYTFTFPNNYESTVESGMGIAMDYYYKVQFVYTVMPDTSYDDVVKQAEDFKEYLNQVNFNVGSYSEKTYNNRKWLIYEGTLKEMRSMYAVTTIDSNKTFQVTIFNLGSKPDSELYVELGKIIDNVKIKGVPQTPKSSDDGNNGQGSGGESHSTTPSNITPSSGAVSA